MKVRVVPSLAYLIVVLSAAACGASAQEGPSTRPAAITGKVIADGEVPLSEMVVFLEPAEPATPIASSKEIVKVSQKGAKFSPALTIVSMGQTVEFVNDEDRLIEHNVFSNAPTKKFDLGMYPPGQSRSVTFDKSGAVFLYCSIHRYMDGVVFVAPTPYTSLVDNDGHYTIANVPAGDWIVKTWQRRRRFPEKTIPVTVATDKASVVDLELKRK